MGINSRDLFTDSKEYSCVTTIVSTFNINIRRVGKNEDSAKPLGVSRSSQRFPEVSV